MHVNKYLRPAPSIFSTFSAVRRCLPPPVHVQFRHICRVSVGFPSRSAQRIYRVRLVVRMVVAIHPFKNFKCDSEEATYFVRRYAKLRPPGDRGVAQCVRGDVWTEPSGLARRAERLVDALDGLALPFDQELICDPKPRPTSDVRQEPGRHPDGGLALVGLLHASGSTIEHTMLGVDPAMSNRGLEGGAANRR